MFSTFWGENILNLEFCFQSFNSLGGWKGNITRHLRSHQPPSLNDNFILRDSSENLGGGGGDQAEEQSRNSDPEKIKEALDLEKYWFQTVVVMIKNYISKPTT